MKRTAIAIAVALAAGAPAAFAGHDYDDYARVTDVDPQYERVNVPRKECYNDYEPQSYYEYGGRSYTTVLPYDPGRRLAVRVDVRPAEGG